MNTRPRYDMAKVRAVAARLRQARQRAGCATMDEGARLARTRSSVYHRHETGVLMPTIWLIERYAAAFGVSPCWLAFGQPARSVASWRKFARDRIREIDADIRRLKGES